MSSVVKVGSGSLWHDPFADMEDRDQAVAQYSEYLLTRADLLLARPTLAGKALTCDCGQTPCHVEILTWLIDHPEFVPEPLHGCAGAVCRTPGCRKAVSGD